MNDLMTKSFTSYVDLEEEALKDLEAGSDGDNAAELEMASRSADENLRHFFEEAGRVREEMDSIREILGRLQEANEESKTVHKPEALKTVRARINSDILSILKTAKKIRDRLEGMGRANSANRRLSGCREGTPIDRTRTSVTNGMHRKLRELMMEFQGLRQRVVAEYKEAVGRRYFTVTGKQPDEAVMERIVSSSDGGGEELLRAAALMHGEGEGEWMSWRLWRRFRGDTTQPGSWRGDSWSCTRYFWTWRCSWRHSPTSWTTSSTTSSPPPITSRMVLRSSRVPRGTNATRASGCASESSSSSLSYSSSSSPSSPASPIPKWAFPD
ncbi:Syntaxin-related protein KNOLLE [Acorus calamus]|uniref:Syntaxin-related protein KNOLLE n=1 Tax=Acorus calamus TaxID=4465 RepID=A0AAV9CWN9_ACOCL|nr:Syntaxin-related protein KNOLLE [Acorus calamus]